jgi:ribonucleoside-diphosphate reductase alpha chain
MTKNPEVRFAKSIVDYIFRWMATKFLSAEAQFKAGVNMKEPTSAEATVGKPAAGKADVGSGFSRTEAKSDVGPGFPGSPKLGTSEGGSRAEPKAPAAEPAAKPQAFSGAAMRNQEDAPPCSTCGSIMIRSGSCYKCANCGTTSGCA